MTTTAPDFSIEFNHSDEMIPAYADRCGCVRCERHRRTHVEPAPAMANAPTGLTPAQSLTDGERRAAAQRAVASVATPALAQAIATVGVPARVVYCECPIGTRPGVVPGSSRLCQSCARPRRERGSYGPSTPAQPTAATAEAARTLGVQTDLRTGGTDQIVSPRDAVIGEIESKLSGGLGATNRDLRKWDALLRSITVTASANPEGYVRHTEVVAGARTNASGIFLGFNGLGSLTRAELAAVIAAAGMPAEWTPTAKSAHAQAGRIVGNLSRHGYIVRAARVPVKTGKPQSSQERGWVARWNVGQAVLGSQVGGSYGTTLLVATLTVGGELKLEGREDLAVTVRAEFDTACSAEIFGAADVTSWLQATLVGRFRAAAVGGNWYVRRKYAAEAEKLCTALAKTWGRNWLLPAIPMTTTEELCAGLVKNFGEEVDVVLKTYRDELAEAQKHGDSEIGTRRATTLLGEVRTLAERAVGFASMFGDRHMMTLREKLCAAADEIAGSIDDISQRFSLIFDELRRDAARDDGG